MRPPSHKRGATPSHPHADWRHKDPECAGDTNHAKGGAKSNASKPTPDEIAEEADEIAKLANRLPPMAKAFLKKLKRVQLLSTESEQAFLLSNAESLTTYTSSEKVGRALVLSEFLTQYQLDRVLAGTLHGMVFGNHRVTERLGAGGMGVVFRAEHMYMKRQVAIKVLPVDEDCPPALLSRFYSEMQVLAGLHHPNIVSAYDSGFVPGPARGEPGLLYLVMELVEAVDLEKIVSDRGPLAIATACEWIAQAARGLQEAHDHNLIHRDIKPSNLLVARNAQIKVVDFGLVQQFNLRQTGLGALLGTIEYMPPEQSIDASSVGTAADVYGLGATLFWVLTGEPPHPSFRSVSLALKNLQENPARPLRSLRPDAPPELESLVQAMLERDPSLRPVRPLSVSRALTAFCNAHDAQI